MLKDIGPHLVFYGILIVLLYQIFSWDNSEFDQGRRDGFSSGYNQVCVPRKTLIYGNWDSEEYRDGYIIGYQEGIARCLGRNPKNNMD